MGTVRDFVFVDDKVSALVLVGQKYLPRGIMRGIGCGEPITILETARVLMKALGRPEAQLAVTGKFRMGDIRFACADIRFAKNNLDGSPTWE